MSTSSPADIADLEEKYNEIHQRRLELEAEFFRIEGEYKKVLDDIVELHNTHNIKNIHHSIDQITS